MAPANVFKSPIPKDKPNDFKTENSNESTGLSSLKGMPPLNSTKEVNLEPVFPVVNKPVFSGYDQDSDIMETFDVISDDSEQIDTPSPAVDTKESTDKYNNDMNDFTDHEVQDKSRDILSKDVFQDDAIYEPKKDDILAEPNKADSLAEPKKECEIPALSSLKGLPPLKLAPLKRETSPLDPLKKPNLNQISKQMLENSLETDPELQETFNRLQNDSMDAVVVEPFDLTEDISLDEENNPTEDNSEIHTTDRSVSPRFVSSVSGHDFVEGCRPKDF